MNHSKPPNLVSQSLFKQFQQLANISLLFLLKVQTKPKRIKKDSRPSKPISESLFKKYQEIPNSFSVFYWSLNPFVPFTPLGGLQYQPIFGQQYPKNGKNKDCLCQTSFKEYSTNLLMVWSLIGFTFVVLKLFMFKVCVAISISKIEFLNFSGTERVKQNQKN